MLLGNSAASKKFPRKIFKNSAAGKNLRNLTLVNQKSFKFLMDWRKGINIWGNIALCRSKKPLELKKNEYKLWLVKKFA